MTRIIGGKWVATELLAVSWSPEMAERFPSAVHTSCRQEMRVTPNGAQPYEPVRCIGWHCNRCGAPTNAFGHHDCPDRPERGK